MEERSQKFEKCDNTVIGNRVKVNIKHQTIEKSSNSCLFILYILSYWLKVTWITLKLSMILYNWKYSILVWLEFVTHKFSCYKNLEKKENQSSPKYNHWSPTCVPGLVEVVEPRAGCEGGDNGGQVPPGVTDAGPQGARRTTQTAQGLPQWGGTTFQGQQYRTICECISKNYIIGKHVIL